MEQMEARGGNAWILCIRECRDDRTLKVQPELFRLVKLLAGHEGMNWLPIAGPDRFFDRLDEPGGLRVHQISASVKPAPLSRARASSYLPGSSTSECRGAQGKLARPRRGGGSRRRHSG
jgi:hypothetical protein